MSALSAIIETAVASVISEHPKLFDSKQTERAQKVLTREIMKSLTREAKRDDEDEPASAEAPASALAGLVPADDPRAIAYVALRSLAGATAPTRHTGGTIYLPAVADCAAVSAFAAMPSRADWIFVTEHRQLHAWREFFETALPDVVRRSIAEVRDGVTGALLPWPWPPSKTGKTYSGEAAA